MAAIARLVLTMTPNYMAVSDHSPSLGTIHMDIRNPDSRNSLQAETDDRRFFDRQLNIRIDKLIQEMGRVQDFVALVAEQQNELSRDIAKERAERMAADAMILQTMDRIEHNLIDRIVFQSGRLAAATIRIDALEARTWWSMLKDSLRRMFYHEKEL